MQNPLIKYYHFDILSGETWTFEYFDCDDFSVLEKEKCTACYAVCFVDEKVVLVHDEKKDAWDLIGGRIEKGEEFEDALKKIVLREENIEVIKYLPISYQKVSTGGENNFSYQLRYIAIGKKVGEFDRDLGGGSVDKIAFVDLEDVTKYFDWGEVGKRILERAGELKEKLLEN